MANELLIEVLEFGAFIGSLYICASISWYIIKYYSTPNVKSVKSVKSKSIEEYLKEQFIDGEIRLYEFEMLYDRFYEEKDKITISNRGREIKDKVKQVKELQ